MLVLAGCSTSTDANHLNVAKAEREIRKNASGVYAKEATVGAVRCPNDVPLKKHLVFTCTVNIDGVPLTVSLRQTDAKGNVRFHQAQAVIFTSKANDFVASYAGSHQQPTSKVSCGTAKVLIRSPQAVVTCKVTYADGTTGAAKLVVRDTSGKVALASLDSTKG